MISRRQFLTIAGGVTVGAAGGGLTLAALIRGEDGAPVTAASAASSSTTAAVASSGRRALVVVQLGGGNDGLNTLVPLDGRYHDARPSLGVADDTLLPIPGTSAYGLHPALGPLTPLVAAGRVAAIESIGYRASDRSHFAALDAWWTATPGEASTTGWLGRYLDLTAGSSDASPLRAIALGGGTPALAAERSRATALYQPADFALDVPRGVDGDALIAAWRAAATGAGAAADAVAVFDDLDLDAAAAPDPDATGDEGEVVGEITDNLAVAAKLLAAGGDTELVYISTGGFDTHANQAATHERLLGDLATGIARFSATVDAAGAADRVLLVTVSEFGRRVAQNGSGGTDHGKASVAFVVGPAVTGGVYGQADLTTLDDGDLVATIDTRSLYTLALDWLRGPSTDVLGGDYDDLGIVP